MSLRALQDHSAKGAAAGRDFRLKASLRWLVEFLPVARPRTIAVRTAACVVHVFTDGARELDAVTIGACVLECDVQPEAFGVHVPQAVVARWRSGGAWQVIGQAELAPAMAASAMRAHRLRDRHVIWWVDQNAARQALTKRYSPKWESAALIDGASQRLASLGCDPWFTRVPSSRNPADFPSRLEWQQLEFDFPGTRRVSVANDAWAY